MDDQKVRDRDKEAKERGKLYADEKRGARGSDEKEGNSVLLKQEQTNKLTPPFRSAPFHVLEKTGNTVVADSPDGVQYKRNSTHVKKSVKRDGLPEGDPSPHAHDKYLKETVEPLVAPAESISEPGPSLVQHPVRAKAPPIRFKDLVMY